MMRREEKEERKRKKLQGAEKKRHPKSKGPVPGRLSGCSGCSGCSGSSIFNSNHTRQPYPRTGARERERIDDRPSTLDSRSKHGLNECSFLIHSSARCSFIHTQISALSPHLPPMSQLSPRQGRPPASSVIHRTTHGPSKIEKEERRFRTLQRKRCIMVACFLPMRPLESMIIAPAAPPYP